jgi:hypothetical protein
MFDLSESADNHGRSGLSAIAFFLIAAGGGLMFVDYLFAGRLILIAGLLLQLLDSGLRKKRFEVPNGLRLSNMHQPPRS